MSSSPPKPWESSNSTSSLKPAPPPIERTHTSITPPPATQNNNSTALVPASSPTANTTGTELISHPNASSDLTTHGNTSLTPMNGGYGSALSSYSSPYSRFGSGYGSGYGGGYGSYGMGMSYGMGGLSPYGMNPGMNGMAMGMGPNAMYGKVVNGGMSLIHGFEHSVNTFGRISALLQMNFEALSMSFSSVLRLFDHVSLLKHEMYGVVQTFTTLKFLHYVYIKFRRMLAFVGVPQVPDMEFNDVWSSNAPKEIRGPNGEILQQQHHASSAWLWLPLTIMVYLMWTLLKWVYRKIREAYQPVDHEALAKEFTGNQANANGNPNAPNAPANAANGNPANAANNANPGQMQLGPDGRPLMNGVNGMMNNGMMNSGYGASGYGYGMNGMSPYSSYGMNGYGNYGSYGSMYGSSLYGNSMYGSSYSPYSSSMYGNGYGYGTGGYGGNPYM